MATLDKKTIAELTKLCRIACTEEEQETLLQDLRKILTYVEELHEVNTENVVPCSHVLEGMANVTREDIIGPTMPRETFLTNAPSHVGGMIRVPPVLKSS